MTERAKRWSVIHGMATSSWPLRDGGTLALPLRLDFGSIIPIKSSAPGGGIVKGLGMIALFRLGIAVFAPRWPDPARRGAGHHRLQLAIDGERQTQRADFCGPRLKICHAQRRGTVTAFVEMAMGPGVEDLLEEPGYGGGNSTGIQIRCVEECGEG